ncbi:glycosyltransferase family 2 protein [Mailhella massiliensis]|uniref:glycosyltransferase family 2 protein n=1 Tax=Mailhella massiliensis TaxID=1903261 RepID=UPI00097DC2C3|nr:glycosyltransferase family 2 protein [Mailhella massiliensis]
MEHPAVSVIIPVWNSGKYFRECLDSVLSQSLRNIEVLIVDDASTDGSGAVAEEYASRDARITVMHQPSSTGAGPARNRAMAVARGEYIAFMDSDDLYPSNDVLETLYHKAVEQNVDVCGGSMFYVSKNGEINKKQFYEYIFDDDRIYSFCEYQHEGGFYRFLYRRKCLICGNLLFPSLRRFQDSLFFIQVMVKIRCFYGMKKCSYLYRKGHKKNIWDRRKSLDYLIGIKNGLDISKKERFFDLYYILVKNLYSRMKIINVNIHDILSVVKEIDFFIIVERNRYNKIKITKLKIYRMVIYLYIIKFLRGISMKK